VDRLPLHPYDIVMLLILIGVTLFGLLKGMAWQLASLASIAVSAFVAVTFSGAIASWFGHQEPWNRFLAMLTLYVVTSLVIWFLFRLISGAIDRVKLQEFDRQVGAVFGLAKGILLCLVITFFAVTLSETARQSVLRSRSGYYSAVLIRNATPVLPQEVRDVLGKYLDEFQRKLNPATPPDQKPAEDTTKRVVDQVAKPVIEQLAKPVLERLLTGPGAGGGGGTAGAKK